MADPRKIFDSRILPSKKTCTLVIPSAEADVLDLADLPERVCPFCRGGLRRKDIRLYRFDCPHCFKALKPCFFPGYLWVRSLTSFGMGLAWAWHRGWTGSFVIFVVSFYALPVMILWDLVVRDFFLPKKIVPATSTFQTLGLTSK